MFGGYNMEFLRNLGETFNGAVDFVIEKNRKFSKVVKLKKQIKKESNSVVKAYITLGKHYYNELRDVPNHEMQKICCSIDTSKKEIKRLRDKLEEVKNEVDLSDFEEFVENEEPNEVEVLFNESEEKNNKEELYAEENENKEE